MLKVGELGVDLVANFSQYNKGFNEAEKATNNWQKMIGNVSKYVATAVAGLGAAMVGAAGYSIKLAAEMEQTATSFKVMLGSGDKASAMLKDLYSFAATTPFEFPEISNAAKQLLAFGIEAKNILPSMQMLGDVAAGLNIPLGDIAYLFGTIKTQGRAMTMDLMQFANRGIPIFDELGKVMGVSSGEIRKFAEEGKIGFAQIEQAFQNMTGEGGKFSGMMVAQSETINGLFSTLKDTVNMKLAAIGQKMIEVFNIKGVMQGLITILGGVNQSYESQANKLDVLIKEYSSLKSKTNLTANEKQRLYDISNKIADIAPEVVSGYTKEGNAIIDLNAALKVQIELKKQELAARQLQVKKEMEGYQKIIDTENEKFKKEKADAEWLLSRADQSIVKSTKEAEIKQRYLVDYNTRLRQHNTILAENDNKVASLKQEYDSISALMQGKVITSTVQTQTATQNLATSVTELAEVYNQFLLKANQIAEDKAQITAINTWVDGHRRLNEMLGITKKDYQEMADQLRKDAQKAIASTAEEMYKLATQLEFIGGLKDIGAALGGGFEQGTTGAINLISGVNKVSTGFKSVQTIAKSTEKSFIEMWAAILGPIGLIIEGLNAIGDALSGLWDSITGSGEKAGFYRELEKLSEDSKKKAEELVKPYKDYAESIRKFSKESLISIGGIFSSGLAEKAVSFLENLDLIRIGKEMKKEISTWFGLGSEWISGTLWEYTFDQAGADAAKAFLERFQDIASGLSQNVGSAFSTGIKDFLSGKADWVTTLKEGIKNAIIDAITTAVMQTTIIKGALGTLLGELSAGLAAGMDVSGIIKQIATTIPTVAAQLEAILTPLKGAISTAFPTMDAGGIVTRPTTANLAVNGKPEAIVPLSRIGSFGGEQTIIIQLDGKTIGRVAAQNMPAYVKLKTGVAF